MNKRVYKGPAATSLYLFITLPEGKCKHSCTLLPYPAHPRCSHNTRYIASVIPTDSSKSPHSCETLRSEESGTLACEAVLDQCFQWFRYSGMRGCVGSVFLMIQVLWDVRLCWISVSNDSGTLAWRLCWISVSNDSGTLACEAVLDQFFRFRFSWMWGCVGSVFLMIQVLWHVRMCWISVSDDSGTLACEAVLDQCFWWFRYSVIWGCVGSVFQMIQVLWHVRMCWISVSDDSGTLACEAVLDRCFWWFRYSSMWGCVGSMFPTIQVLLDVRMCWISVSDDSGTQGCEAVLHQCFQWFRCSGQWRCVAWVVFNVSKI